MIHYHLSNEIRLWLLLKLQMIKYSRALQSQLSINKYHNMELGLELDEDKPHRSGQKFNPRFHVAKATYADLITPMCKALGRRTPSMGVGKGNPFLLSKIHETNQEDGGVAR